MLYFFALKDYVGPWGNVDGDSCIKGNKKASSCATHNFPPPSLEVILRNKCTLGKFRYTLTKLTDTHSDVRKWSKFYGHIKRMEPSRLTKRFVKLYENRDTINYISIIKEDVDITLTEITEENF